KVVDANVTHLEHAIPLNGSFRIFVFAGKPSASQQALRDLARNLENKTSFFSRYQRPDVERVSHHEHHNPHSMFCTFSVIFAAPRSSIEISRDVPGVLGRYRENIFADDRG